MSSRAEPLDFSLFLISPYLKVLNNIHMLISLYSTFQVLVYYPSACLKLYFESHRHLKSNTSKSEFLISSQNLVLPQSCVSLNSNFILLVSQARNLRVIIHTFLSFPTYHPSANPIGSTIKIYLESGCCFLPSLLPW